MTPATRELWRVLRSPGREGLGVTGRRAYRTVIWMAVKRSTPPGTPLAALLLASGAIE